MLTSLPRREERVGPAPDTATRQPERGRPARRRQTVDRDGLVPPPAGPHPPLHTRRAPWRRDLSRRDARDVPPQPRGDRRRHLPVDVRSADGYRTPGRRPAHARDRRRRGPAARGAGQARAGARAGGRDRRLRHGPRGVRRRFRPLRPAVCRRPRRRRRAAPSRVRRPGRRPPSRPHRVPHRLRQRRRTARPRPRDRLRHRSRHPRVGAPSPTGSPTSSRPRR